MNPPFTAVHLTYNVDDKPVVACIGSSIPQFRVKGANLSHPGYQCSGDPRAVTCLICKKTTMFKQILDGLPK